MHLLFVALALLLSTVSCQFKLTDIIKKNITVMYTSTTEEMLHTGNTDLKIEDMQRKDIDVTSEAVVIETEKKGCGWRQAELAPSPGSIHTLFGEFPWVVAVFRYKPSLQIYEYLCGGSLIHPKVVLTVKHYFTNPERLRIRAGDWDILRDYEIHYHQSSDVETVEGHADFTKKTFDNDVALLFLRTAINEAPNVRFACLPPPNAITPAGKRCIFTGWGHERYNGTVPQNILKMVDVPVVDKPDCQSRLGNILRHNVHLGRTSMCAGGEQGRDACLRDGGSPLMCPYQGNTDRYYQAGIVSWGIRCGLNGIPGVYTDVANTRNWIDQRMREKGYTSDTYTP